MKVKRLVALLLATSMTVSLLSGCGGKEAYRTIAVSEVNGTTTIAREKADSFDAYAGAHLYSGDDATVKAASDLTLELDNDKHVYAEENTHFYLTASGKEANTKTVINLTAGSVLVKIDNKLEAEESFEVDTPNSTMSVRGTVFRVSVEEKGGVTNTRVSTYEGVVEAALKDTNGALTGEKESIAAGEEIVIETKDGATSFAGAKSEANISGIYEGTKKKLEGYKNAGTSLLYTETASAGAYEEKLSHWKLVYEHDVDYYGTVSEYTESGAIARVDNDKYYSIFTYDSENRLTLIETYRDFADTETGQPYRGLTLTGYVKYDEKGNVVEEMQNNFEKYYYTYYDDNTRASETAYLNMNNYVGERSAVEDYQFYESIEYDEHGNPTYTGYYEFFGDDREMIVETNSYVYNENGDMVSQTGTTTNGIYEYDENGNLIHDRISYDDERYGLHDREERFYEYALVNGEYKLSHKTENYENVEYGSGCNEFDYTYDKAGTLISVCTVMTSYTPEGDVNEYGENRTTVTTYTYDEFGNLILESDDISHVFYPEENGIEATEIVYSPAEFPEGKPGDIFVRTKAVSINGSPRYSYVYQYRYE